MIQLFHGDCMDFLKTIPDKSIDLVVTDPPYIVGTRGGAIFGENSINYMQGQNHKPYFNEEIEEMADGFSETILNELYRVMKKINCYFFCSQKQIPILVNYFVNKKGCNWNLLAWHKSNPIPACGNKYLSDSEYILFFREKGVKIYGSYDTKHTYYVSPANMADKEKYGHPTIKPLDIVKNLIINSSQENDTVLDPFMGSGTTGVACKELGRSFLGSEIKDEYFTLCQQRIGKSDIVTTQDWKPKIEFEPGTLFFEEE